MTQHHFIGRLPKDGDLLESLGALCRERECTRGSVQLIGALQRARLGFYLQQEQRYLTHDVAANSEILVGLGNISLKDGQPFVHLHLTLGLENGTVLGGHAMTGCIVFAAEVVLQPLDGEPLVRELDAPTGLPLWKV